MTTLSMNNEHMHYASRSRSSSFRKGRKEKDNFMNFPSSRPISRPTSRPTSQPTSRSTSRPTSRPESPTFFYNGSNDDSDNEPIIPTAIVIKNIPFSVKKDALLSKFASMDIPTAYAFNYHFDNGIFRGLAFANYKTPEETEVVVNKLNGFEIGGRKLRVEYKKVLLDSDENKKKEREIHMSSSSSTPRTTLSSPIERKINSSNNSNTPDEDTLDLNDANILELYSYLLLFRGDPTSTEIALPKSFSAKERRDAHLIAERLGLAHYSEGCGNDRQVIVEKKNQIPPTPIVRLQNKESRGSLKSSPSRDRLSNTTNHSNCNVNNVIENKREGYKKSMMKSYSATDLFSDNIIHPVRQPRGPEPGRNFFSRKLVSCLK